MTPQVTAQVTPQVAAFSCEPQPAKTIMAELGFKHMKTFQANHRATLMATGIVDWTILDKSRSRMQRYRRTDTGLAVMKNETTNQGSGRGGGVHA